MEEFNSKEEAKKVDAVILDELSEIPEEPELTAEEVKEGFLNRKQRRQLAKHKKSQQRKMDAAIETRKAILEAGNKYTNATTDFALFNYILETKDFSHCATAMDSLRFMYENLWPTIARLTNQSMFMELLIDDANVDMSDEELAMWNKIRESKNDMPEETAKALEIQKASISRKSSKFAKSLQI